MNGRKTMKTWQMIVAVVLLAAMLITIFLPAIHLNGKSLRKALEKVVSGEMVDQTAELAGIDMDEIEDQIDQAIQTAEKAGDIKLTSISFGNIMTRDAGRYFWVDEDKTSDQTEILKSLKFVYNTLRIILWIVYIAAILVIVLTILGFVFEWSKYIPLGISAGYGLAVAGIFGFLRFVMPGTLAKNNFFKEAFAEVPISESLISSMISRIFTSFLGCAFLVVLIIAVLILVWSVVSMFVGGSKKIIEPPILPPRPPVEPPYIPPVPDTGLQDKVTELEKEKEKLLKEKAALEKALQENQNDQQPQMGQVVCIKGVAVGQGFSLPETAKIVVGKSRQNTNMLINSPMVSNVHCSIRYKAATNTYIVKDHSSNGTYVNGARLQKDVPMSFSAGTVLQLADGSNEIKLG